MEAHCAAMLAAVPEATPPSVEGIPPVARDDPPPPARQPLLSVSGSAATISETAVLERDDQYGAGILRYVRTVVSLIEARRVSAAEILEMLQRTKRQHSFARERRIDYLLRRLREEPQKPP